MTRPRRLRLEASTAWIFGLIAWVSFAPQARAQDFFRSSPGALSQSHAEWDHEGGCPKCHKSGGGVTNGLCLDCHTDLAKLLDAGKGLHATFKGNCTSCHTEHKGRASMVSDWADVGGLKAFQHERTGFTLKGKHASATCTQCHKHRTKSGFISYMKVSDTCVSCHAGVHQLTNPELERNCQSCHTPGVARNMTANELPFNHAAVTGTALTGGHAEVRCLDCHKGAVMRMKPGAVRTCVTCHDQPHGKTFKKWECTDCHSLDVRWNKPTFTHESTRMPLRGGHKTTCSKCHLEVRSKPSIACAGCHNDPHQKRFAALDACTTCHTTGGTETVRFAHDKRTKFALTGKHKDVGCRACHRGSGPTEFEKFPTASCLGCHRHKNAHNGQFNDKQCLDCHQEGGSKKLDFDHQKDTRFPLVGAHLELGKKNECDKCHPAGDYRNGKLRCIDCHRSDDVHKGALGETCETCHEPVPGASLFDHEELTAFARTGRHRDTKCVFCHQVLPEGAPPPPRGWIQTAAAKPVDRRFPVMGTACAECHFDIHAGRYGSACDGCHNTTNFNQAVRGFHDSGVFRLEGVHDTLPCRRCHETNRRVEGSGELCRTCHFEDDVHQGGLGMECGDCHGQIDWLPTRFQHATTGFALRGAHRISPCEDCHRFGTYAGTPTECVDCHQGDAQRVGDPLHTAELSTCDDCHGQAAFLPARNHHPWFPLIGQHRLLRCSNCHVGGVYAGQSPDCDTCHMQAYLDPGTEPDHLAVGFGTTCSDCHTPVSWVPAVDPR